MATAIHPHWIPALLLVLCFAAPGFSGEDPPERSSPPGSAGELFNPSADPQPSNHAVLPPSPRPIQPEAPRLTVATPNPDAGAVAPLEAPIWLGIRQADRERRKLKNKSDQDWGFVESEFVLQAPEAGYDSPFERGQWSTEDLFAVPLTGPLYVFTGVEMGGQYSADQSMKVIGRTGVLWKLPVTDSTAIEVRGGPAVKYNNALSPDRSRDQGAMLWEVKAKCPLIGPFNLEYLGEALPALTPEDRSQLKQDLNLFIPVSGGKVKFGAKHRWEPGQVEARNATGLMQLYMGIEIGR